MIASVPQRAPPRRLVHPASAKFRHPPVLFMALFLLPLLVLTGLLQFSRPLPPLAVINSLRPEFLPPAQVDFPWPGIGSAAVAVDGIGQVGAFQDDRQRPIASLVKIMTAYVVLKDHHLNPGDKGPDLTVSPDDVRAYRAGIANAESVVEVRPGEVISQFDLLQG